MGTVLSRTYSLFEERKRWPTLFDFSLRNSWKILGIWVAQTAQAEHHNAYKLLLFWSTLLVIPSGADQGFLSRSVTLWGSSIGALCYKLVCLNTQTTLPFGLSLLQTSLVMYNFLKQTGRDSTAGTFPTYQKSGMAACIQSIFTRGLKATGVLIGSKGITCTRSRVQTTAYSSILTGCTIWFLSRPIVRICLSRMRSVKPSLLQTRLPQHSNNFASNRLNVTNFFGHAQ